MIMYEAHEEEYAFCPKCGALMKGGVCVNCGYGREEAAPDGHADAGNGEVAETGGMNDGPQDAGGFAHRNGSGWGPQNGAGWGQQNDAGYGPQNGSGCGPQQNGAGYGPRPGEDFGWNGAGNHPGYGSQSAGGYGPQNTGGYGPRNGAGYGPQNGGYGPQNGAGYGSQGGQGPWQGQPYGQNFGGGMPPYGPQGYGPYGTGPDRRNNGKVLVAVIITVLAILLCIAMVLVFFLVRNSVSTSRKAISEWQEEFGSPYPDGGYGPEWYGQLPYGYEAPRETVPEQEPEETYVPSADDDYYVTLANAVRDDLSYSIEWEEYDLTDDETGATAVGRYPQLVGGNIPQLEELNDLIETEATYFSTLYDYYRSWQGENVDYNVESTGYVTYMDEEKISIVLEESYVMDGQSSISLYSINIDLISGEVLNNGNMIEYSQQLVDEFRSQNDYQNGQVTAVENMDDEQLLDFLSDENTNIVFYTPVGLEIGFNYTTSDSTGWVTATIKNYERYVTKF